MVILYSKEGQLANRLWQSAHFIANSLEYKYKLIHLGFSHYEEHFSESFENLRGNGSYILTSRNGFSFLTRLLFLYIRISKKVELKFKRHLPLIKNVYFMDYSALRYYIAEPRFINWCKKKIVLVDGWFYEDKRSLTKHADVIRNIFTPNSKYLKNVEKLKTENFANYDAVVGVHIRRGDYKTYNNGIWYYSDEEYQRFMTKVLSLKAFENKKIAFLICSDAELDFNKFSQFNIIIPTKNFIEDMYSLAECDFIIGPPSTYSAWASFYGEVPVLHMYNRKTEITEELFQVVDYAY